MKKTSAFVAMLAAGLLWGGCSSSSTSTETTTTTTTTTETPAPAEAPASVASFTGTYEMNNGEEEGELMVDESDTGIRFRLTAHAGNEAEADFTGSLTEDGAGGYVYDDDACQIGFQFTADGCDVKYNADPIGCGLGDGAADVAGHYAKASSEKPSF